MFHGFKTGSSGLYQKNIPFPHIVIDGAFEYENVFEFQKYFPKPDTSWWLYDNVLERKFAKNDISAVDPVIKHFIYYLNSNEFIDQLETLTGIQGLIADHTLNGGGLHQIARGGKLDIHCDYNYHPITALDRRVNVLIYLNPGWQAKWGGDLELWDKDMMTCVRSIAPVFNRMVVFSITDFANHGHPEPLTCPEGVTRKSIAMYYYTNGRPKEEKTPPHSTIFKRRPNDPILMEIEELREKRAIRRLT